jgi:hypothetical protein
MRSIDWASDPAWVDAGTVLMGSITVPSEIRRPADNGDDRLEIDVIGPDANERCPDVLAQLPRLLLSLADLRQAALRAAPREWTEHFGQPELWLMAIEFEPEVTRLVFDFGDSDSLVLTIAPSGDRTVCVRP